MRLHFRDAKEWKDSGMKITGASNEACKLYDAALSQIVSWGYETHYGTLDEIMPKIGKAAPESVLPQSLSVGLNLTEGKTIYDDNEVKQSVGNLLELAKKQENELSEREKSHITAIDLYSQGRIDEAILEWENVLIDHPTDIHALYLAFLAMFYSGRSKEIMNLFNGVANHYNKSVPLYEYMGGLQSFGFEEAGLYDKAEKIALNAIELAPYDIYAHHALAHVYEMTRRLEEGRNFLEKSAPNWLNGPTLACHVYWHNALFYLENCEFEPAVEIYDSKIKPYLTPDNFLAFSDVASLFYRLKMAGYDIGNQRWRELNAMCDYHIDKIDKPFTASHVLMGVLGSQDSAKKEKILESTKEMLKIDSGFKSELYQDVGLNLLNGICKFDSGEYDEAVSYFRPIRQSIYRIGGSHAQRDVYDQLICYAALNSKSEHNQNFARQLMAERQATMSGSLTDKMASQLLASHFASE